MIDSVLILCNSVFSTVLVISTCLSVCLSITLVCCIKMAELHHSSLLAWWLCHSS